MTQVPPGREQRWEQAAVTPHINNKTVAVRSTNVTTKRIRYVRLRVCYISVIVNATLAAGPCPVLSCRVCPSLGIRAPPSMAPVPAGAARPTLFLKQGGATVLPTHVLCRQLFVHLGKIHVGNLSESHSQYDGPVVARPNTARSLRVRPAAYRSTCATATRISQCTRRTGQSIPFKLPRDQHHPTASRW